MKGNDARGNVPVARARGLTILAAVSCISRAVERNSAASYRGGRVVSRLELYLPAQ